MRLKSMFLPTAVVMLHVTFFVGCGGTPSSTSNGDNVGLGPPVSPPSPPVTVEPPPLPEEPPKPKELEPTTTEGYIRVGAVN